MRDKARFVACCGTDIGTGRKSNQDAVSVKAVAVNGKTSCMAVVCDGVGGLALGEYAGRSMRRQMESWFLYEYPQISDKKEAARIIPERMRRMVEVENEALYEYGRRHGIRCATTVSALLLTQHNYHIVHVGDSRIYLLDGRLRQMTEDQTLVAKEVKLGQLTEEEASLDARRNVLLQCVGADKSVEILTYEGEYQQGSSWLVCSDGFYHHVNTQELEKSFFETRYTSSEELGYELKEQILLMKKRGEKDNISAAVIQTGAAGAEA